MTKIMANTKEQISRNMRSNKSKDTKPELMLRKELWRRGLRYRKNYKSLAGKPDIVFLRAQIAVFVDGKMWHATIGNVKSTISKAIKIFGSRRSNTTWSATLRSRKI